MEKIKTMLISEDKEINELGIAMLAASYSWKEYRGFLRSVFYLDLVYPIRKAIRKKMVEIHGKRDENGKLIKKYGKL